IRKKIIKGVAYYYFEFPINIISGKKLFTKYLGKSIPPEDELKTMLNKFFEEIAEIVIENISKNIKEYFPPNGIRRIEECHAWYHLLNHEINSKKFQQFKDLFTILFVLNSNRAEGSRVTRKDIESIVKKKRKPKTLLDREIVNSFDALNFAFSEKMKWNVASVKKIHKILFKEIDDEIAGKYKTSNNVVGQGGIASITTPKEKVKEEMKDLIKWLNKNKKNYPPILALEFHWRFERIHPFQDGNGRVGRILLNAWLFNSFFMPVIFFSENHEAYGSCIAASIEGRKNKWGKYFIEQIKKTTKRIEEYKKEGIIKGGSTSMGHWEIQRDRIRIY
ncbi:MAG: Fic family protein, partial [Nanoarchaeota archaeon]|nr:Fic family protein [Nanoarchaeota archaeon]